MTELNRTEKIIIEALGMKFVAERRVCYLRAAGLLLAALSFVQPPDLEVNSDSRADFGDFMIMATHWLKDSIAQ